MRWQPRGGFPGAPIPALFGSYLRAGAKVALEPALDRDFQCLDYLTVLRLNQLTESFEKRYSPVRYQKVGSLFRRHA